MGARPATRNYGGQEKSSGKFVYVLLIAVISLSIYSYLTIDSKNQKIDSLDSVIAEKNLDIKVKEGQIDTIQSENSGLRNTVKSKETIIVDLSDRLGLAESEISELTPIIKSYYAVGVKSDGTGVVIPLEVKIRKGTGAISANIRNVDMLEGAQQSIRTAATVAQDFTGFNLGTKDTEVTFKNDLNEIVAIDGPSAGAAITITLIGALQNKTMNTKVLMTGTIENDGSIGKVGSVQGKAEAARIYGATNFLVPVGQDVDVAGLQVSEVKEISNVIGLVLK